MATESAVLQYDNYGTLRIEEGQLAAIVPSALLTEVGGGFLDGGCKGNALCGNLINVGLCVDALCGQNFRDVACVSNAVCVTP